MAAVAAAKLVFMVVATLCATKQGVDTCLIQADTKLVATRQECVARGKELISFATTAFGYARMPVPYRTKIYCAPKGTTVAKAQTQKPAAVGTADLPAPVITVKTEPNAAPPAAPWYSPITHLWPF